MRSFARRTLGVVAALFLASCFGDSTGPRESRRAPLAFAPVFDSRALLVVDFERVRIRLVRPGSGAVVLDTVVSFPSDADSIALSLSVPVQGTAENFSLTLAMISAAGDTVFRAGPVIVTATLGVLPREPSEIQTVYVGTGANAASVRFTTPVPPAAFFGDTVVVAAQAFDSAGRAIAGTPVVYRMDPRDTALARVPDPRVGHVVVKSVRGPARIIAELLTHQTDTATLNVQPRPGAIAIRSGSGQTAPVRATLAQPITVRVTAADGLGVEGAVVTFAVTSGGGTLSASADTTDANGDASVSWTLGGTVGAQTMTAATAGITSSAITATATSGGPSVASTTVTPHLDTLTALGATFALAAQAKDTAGNPVAGTFTWTSRTPAVATVGAAGLVTAVANGSTWVVATEAGGTKDSAQIVVEQRIASITVTPGGRELYPTGRFTFTATAVDGGGTPIPTQPAFTWSSAAPAVASVDAAGNVTALGLGTTQIRATSGTITGVATLSVITPIKRIAVVVDTVGAFKTSCVVRSANSPGRRSGAAAKSAARIRLTADAASCAVSRARGSASR